MSFYDYECEQSFFTTKKSKILINVDEFNLLIKKVEVCSVFFLEMFSSDTIYLFSDRND